jgi:AhpD family alkylhydroperoxidase
VRRLEPARPRGVDPVRRVIYGAARRLYGRTLAPTKVVAHHRPLLVGYSTIALFGDRYSRSVEKHLKELAMLRTAQLVECEWCLDFGSWLASHAGVTEEQLRELAVWRQSDRFGTVERLVLEYAEAMTRTPADVSDELFAALRQHFDERQLVELTMTIGLENLYSRTNHAMGVEGEGFSEGMYCVRPESSVAADDLEAVPGAR